MKKTALIFTHDEDTGPAILKDLLNKWDFASEEIFTPGQGIGGKDADLLVVMGGPMGVYESDKYLYLKEEMRFLEKRLAAARPVLGICLGSQLMAKALGAEVYKGRQGKEIGWFDIAVNEEGKKTPVAHFEGPMFHWHGDTFDFPQDATLLASSEKYPHQAFSYGVNALALQFHPEVKANVLENWYEELEAPLAEKVRLDTQKNIGTLNMKVERFFKDWLTQTGLL